MIDFKPLDKNDEFILACSLWVDSLFLLYKLIDAWYKNFTICYFNHKLRKEADIEQEYILWLWEELWVKVEIWEADINKEIQENNSISLEEIARKKRYDFLREIKSNIWAKYILTGHHRSDKIETFMFNLSRWSKISWLVNMKRISGDIFRPLINEKKTDFVDYMKKNNLKFFEDKTNKDNKITRNFIRNEILPNFWKINSNYQENILSFIEYIDEIKENIDREIEFFIWEKNYFEKNIFDEKSEFMKREIIRYCFYKANNNSTIGLSKANIDEIIKFINWKNNKTKKEIKMLKMLKDWNKIYFLK